MKKLLILLSLSFSIAASAQVDPAFTAKMVNVVNTAVTYYQNQTTANLQSATNAVLAFHPITNELFSSKLNSMLGSGTEMAKFTSPITFVQCLATQAGQFNSCIRNIPSNCHWEGDELMCDLPTLEQMAGCQESWEAGIVQCIITHLTR